MKVDENSMLIWYPKIKDMDILQPKTEFLILPENTIRDIHDEKFILPLDKIKEKVNKIGYPVFIRTDLASGKQKWKKTCNVNKEEN